VIRQLSTLILFAVTASAQVPIPAGDDWENQGTVIVKGGVGDWDEEISGAIGDPGAIIKLGDTYFLYYIGSDGRRADGGPAHRRLGVATSSDGVHFTKHPSNPILEFSPFGCDEEGVFSVAPVVVDSTVFLYYGGMHSAYRKSDCTSVNASIRVAISTDGIAFSNDEEVVNGKTAGCAGCGDEIYPVAAFRRDSDGIWFIYYNGGGPWDLYLIAGPAYDRLIVSDTTDKPVLNKPTGLRNIGRLNWLDADTFALFIGEYSDAIPAPSRPVAVYIVEASDPYAIHTTPDERYESIHAPFAENMHATTYLDRSVWRMIYGKCTYGPCRDSWIDAFGLRTAARADVSSDSPRSR